MSLPAIYAGSLHCESALLAPFNQEDGMSCLSRRSLVATGAALPALAVPAIAIVAAAEHDPTFAVIEAHRSALLEAMRATKFWNEMCPSDPRYPIARAESSAAGKVDRSAQFELANVVPTTRNGVFALMEYIEALYTAKIALPEDPAYYASGGADNYWISRFETDDPDHGIPLQLPLTFWVMRNVRTALKSLSVQS